MSVLYLLHPGLGGLGPAAVRRCSGEARPACHSIAECRKVALNLRLLNLQLKILLLSTSFCFNIISLEFDYQTPLPVPDRSHPVFGNHQLVLRGVKFLLYLMNGSPVLKEEQLRKCGDIYCYSYCVLPKDVTN